MRGVVLLLAAAASVPVTASTCLVQTAPEVADELVIGDPKIVRQAIDNLDSRAAHVEPGQSAPWLTAQASMLLDLNEHVEAERRLSQAISLWMRTDRIDAEICARHLLVYSLSARSRTRVALAEVLLAKERARLAGLTDTLNRLNHSHIALLMTLNERIEEGLVLLRDSQPGELNLDRMNWHHTHGLLLGRLQRHREAAEQFESLLQLALKLDHGPMIASARFNLATELIMLGIENPDATPTEHIKFLFESIIDDSAARASTRAMALRSLSRLVPAEQQPGLLERCIEQASSAGDDRRRSVCLADLARRYVKSEPDRSIALLDQAIALAKDDPNALWLIQSQRLAVIWATRDPVQAFDDSLVAIAGEKLLRDAQMLGPDRHRLIDGLMGDYRQLAHFAFIHMEDFPELAARAFELLESNRAVGLREQWIGDEVADGDRIRQLALRFNEVQQRVLVSGTNDSDSALDELTQLEREWARATTREPDQLPPLPKAVELAEVQSALDTDEAMLSFLTEVPGESADHGWVQVITGQSTALHPVPDPLILRTATEMLHGMSNWQQDSARQLLQRLGSELLLAALSELPSRISHLIILPDAGLEDLPIELLGTPDGQMLGHRYSLDLAPSASIWLTARQQQPASGQVLILADPELPASGYQALDPAFPDQAFAALPNARREGRDIQRLAGRDQARLVLGASASEELLMDQSWTGTTSLLHLATHTLVHGHHAERSAILLTGGDRGRDGLLQPREIEQLDLSGTGVVLASCASASGQWLDSEGLLSLARSFLVAGAPTVVATRWPVDDHDSRRFFREVYASLASGQTLNNAMRNARISLHEQGYPPRAWSGYLVYGDSAWQPIERSPRWPGYALIILSIILTLACLNRLRHRLN